MTTVLKALHGNSAALTLTINGLASDTNLLAGRSSAVVDNTTNLSDDELITYVIKTGTSPTAGTSVLIYVWCQLDDTPTYPDAVTGSDANVTITSSNVLAAGAFILAKGLSIDATSNRVYSGYFSLKAQFQDYMPKKWGIFVVHNTAVALNAAGNTISRIPLQYQNV